MMSKPIHPRKPCEPRKPEQFIVAQQKILVEDSSYITDLDIDYVSPRHSQLNYLILDVPTLRTIIKTMNITSIDKEIPFDALGIKCTCEKVFITYDVKVENHL